MKKNLILMSFLALSIFAFGQAQESITPQHKEKITSTDAVKITLPYSPEVVVKALNNFVLITGRAEAIKAKGFNLSEDTRLVNNNINGVDMHFFVTLKESDNPNVTDLYLNLASSTTNNEDNGVVSYFDMKEAKDYLDNLEIAITHFATDLQLQLQNKNLSKSKAATVRLKGEADKLNKKQQSLQQAINREYDSKKYDRLTKRIHVVNQKVDKNIINQSNQRAETFKQSIALAILINRIKA